MKITVKVIPSASCNKVEVIKETELKVYVTSSPQKGKANKQMINVLSHFFGTRKSALRIVKGETSRQKVIEIDDSFKKR